MNTHCRGGCFGGLEEWVGCSHSLRCLIRNGIDTMEKLSALSYDELLSIRGIGPVIAGGLLKDVARWRTHEKGGCEDDAENQCL